MIATKLEIPNTITLGRLASSMKAAANKSLRNNPGLAVSLADQLHAQTISQIPLLHRDQKFVVDREEYLSQIPSASDTLYLQDGADLKRHALRSLLSPETVKKALEESYQYPLDWSDFPSIEETKKLMTTDDRDEYRRFLYKILTSSLIPNLIKIKKHIDQTESQNGFPARQARVHKAKKQDWRLVHRQGDSSVCLRGIKNEHLLASIKGLDLKIDFADDESEIKSIELLLKRPDGSYTNDSIRFTFMNELIARALVTNSKGFPAQKGLWADEMLLDLTKTKLDVLTRRNVLSKLASEFKVAD